MDKHEAGDLVRFIREHSQHLNESSVVARRNAPRSQTYYVAAMVSTQVPEGTKWHLEYFMSREQFTDSPWYDRHKPLRTAVSIAKLVEAQRYKVYTEAVLGVSQDLGRLSRTVETQLSQLDRNIYTTAEKLAEQVQADVLGALPQLHLERLPVLAAELSAARVARWRAEDDLRAAEGQPQQ